MIKPGQETYLGDGLFVSFDGFQICLRAEGNRVYLEPAVWYCLLAFVKRHLTPAFAAGFEGESA